MNALNTLQELRQARSKRRKHASLCETVKGQLEQILVLKKEKAVLAARLEALQAGQTVEDLSPWDDADWTRGTRILRELKERLAAYKLIGPCGVTVKEVDSTSLEVTLSPTWRSVRESFALSLEADDDLGMKVTSTNIPYFVDVPSLVAGVKSDVLALIDAVSLKLIAYVQRKGDVEHVLKTQAGVVAKWSVSEPVTSVDLRLQSMDASTEILKRLDVYVSYPSVDDVQPDKVEFTPENLSLPSEMEEELRHEFLTTSLPSAMARVAHWLISTEALVDTRHTDRRQSDQDDDDGDEDVDDV